jgi:putative transposase
MPSTHLSLHYYIVFSTKDRRLQIEDEWSARLHEYLGGLTRAASAIPECIGNATDHVHLLVGLKATHTLSSFIQDIKQTSSRWIHETIGVKDFAWQQGYAAFTVSVSNCEAVKPYIIKQPEHHRTKTFQEEYLALLKRHEIAYEEKYLW